LQAKRDRITEYKARHAAVGRRCWKPCLVPAGTTTLLILREDGLLIGYLETKKNSAGEAIAESEAS
jgi:L-rhamnose mutarotase